MTTPSRQEASRAAAGPATGEASSRTGAAAASTQPNAGTQPAAPAAAPANQQQDTSDLFTLGMFAFGLVPYCTVEQTYVSAEQHKDVIINTVSASELAQPSLSLSIFARQAEGINTEL